MLVSLLSQTKSKETYTTYVTSKENGLIEGGNLGSFYRYVNSKFVHKTGIGVLIDNGSYTMIKLKLKY